MICNNAVTIYHKGIDATTMLETWTRYNYKNAWIVDGESANINKGYDNVNSVEVRLPYDSNELDINNFAIGDIIVKGTVTTNIERQQDLSDYDVYNITSITNNDYGFSKHIHLGGM